MKPLSHTSPCPCTSGAPYGTCCAPYHRGEREPGEPERVLRSRFAAFVMGNADYLWRTLHPDHDDRRRPREQVIAELRDASRNNRYLGLTLLDRAPARLLFVARVFCKGKDRSFAEVSDFAEESPGAWRYLTGRAVPASALGGVATIRAFDEAGLGA